MLEAQDDYYDGLDQAARESQQAQQAHDAALVQDGQDIAEEDKNTGHGTREAVAQELDGSPSGQAARLLVDNWLANDDAETVHEQIDGVDDSQWDAEMKQRLHEYVDAPVRAEETNSPAEGEIVLSDEVDEKGRPFVEAEDGTTVFGRITDDSGLSAAPIKLSEGFQDENTGKGYGLIHIEANHGKQIRNAGFASAKDFVSYVAANYDPNNIRVGKRRSDGSMTFLIQVTDTRDNTLFVELSKDGSYWNVNSGGIFRKGYSNKKETVAKTEPKQPNNAVSSGSSLSANDNTGISYAEPNGEPTVSTDKVTPVSSDGKTKTGENAEGKELPRDKDGNLIYDQVPVKDTVEDLYDGNMDDQEVAEFVSVQTKEAEKALAKAERSKPAITANKAKNLEAKRKWEAAVQEARRKVDYWHSVTQEIDRLTRDEGARASEATQTSETTVTGETLAARVLAGSKILPESFRKETGYGPEEQKRYVGLISNDGQTIDHLAEELVDLDNTENNGGFFAGDTYAAKEAILSALQQAGTRGELLELAQGKSTHEGLAEHEEQVRDEYYLSRYGMTYDDYQAYVEQEMPALLRRYSGYDETAFLNAYAEEIERELRARENDRTREEQGDGRSAEVLPGERTGEPAGVDESAGPRSQSETRDGSPVEEAAVREGAETEGKDAPEEKNDVSGESGSGVQEVRPLSDEEATHLLTRMEENAEEIPQLELNPSNWNAQFGEKGVVSTPVGQVKMGENQIAKLFERGRSEQFGMIKPTLEAPQVVIEVPSESIDNTTERGSSLLFVKTFIQKDGRKIYYFKSVTVRKDGLEVSVSSHYDRPKRIKDALKNGKLLYRFDGGAQTEHHPADVSVTASPKHAQGVSEARQAESEGGLFLVLPSESSKEAGGLSSRARGLSSADKVTPVSSDGEAKAEKNEVKEGKTPSSIPQNPAVQNHDWSQYKKGDVFDINGYKVRFDYVEREEDGSVRGVAVTHLDENGKPKEHGGELVPPLMFMHEFKPVKEEKKSVPTENHQRSPLNEGGQDKKMHLAERIAKALGAKLVIVDHMEENGRFTVNRRTGERTITIARDAENPLSFVFGHESLHAVRSLSEEAYKNLRDMVKAAMGEEAWNAEVAKAVEMYKGQKGYNSLGDYEEEVVAEFLGSVLNDQQRMADLARRLDRPVLSAIMDVLRKMRDWFRQDHMTAQERWTGEVLEIVENAYTQAAKTGKGRRTDSRASLRQSSSDLFEEAQRMKREEERKAAAKEIADKYGLDEALLSRYDEGMRQGNSATASNALWDLRSTYQKEHAEERKALMEREGVNGLVANKRLFAPIEKAIKERFGDVEDLIAEQVRQAEEERNLMEAARKRAEEERQKRQARLDELAALSETEIDKQYADAMERGDETLAREMLEEAARRKGYGDSTSEYQGVGAWVAPSNPGYDTDQERREASKEDSIDLNVEDMAAGYSNQPLDIFKNPGRYSQGLATSKESGRAIQTAIDKIKRGEKGVKVKVYRAVPTTVKEGKLRNGDWVTPSRAYAEMHGDHRLEGKYRIIEDEVPAGELWWDSNDVNEWGYDNGKNYRYKNAKNNRKLNDLVTRDDKGNIIPPSKRFNSRKADERYSLRDGGTSTDLFAQAKQMREDETALRDALTDRIREAGIEVITNTEAGQRVLDMANGKDVNVRIQAKISVLTKAANTIHTWLTNNMRGKSFTIELPESTRRMVQKVMGRDFDSHSITANGIAHAKKNHGVNGNKLGASSIALRDEDFELLPYIMIAPDYVRKGTSDITGRESVRFYKTLSNGYVVVAEKEYKNSPNDMETITMWADTSSSAATNARRNAPDTHVQNAILSTEDTAKIRKDAEMAIARDQKLREHRVYHGSGADFDHFDHSHMGDGEGAQAYGWGTYVTEVEGIGRMYADTAFLNNEHLKEKRSETPLDLAVDSIVGQERYNSTAKTFEQRKSVGIENSERIIPAFEKRLSEEKDSRKVEYLSKAIKRQKATLEGLRALTEERYNEELMNPDRMRMRHLYMVEIPDDTGKNYLKWDKKVPAKTIRMVAKAIEANEQARARLYTQTRNLSDGWDSLLRLNFALDRMSTTTQKRTGWDLYDRVCSILGSNKSASKFLSSLGFTGIKYPAQYRSGGRSDGASNYVIFDENDLKITDHVRFFRGQNGEAYGFTVGGKIYLDPRVATAETPLHEYTHLWATALQQRDGMAWQSVVELMKGTSVWNEVRRAYPELKTDDEVADEVLATYSGRRGAERLREEMRKAAEGKDMFAQAAALQALDRVRKALRDFWHQVASLLHLPFTSAEGVADQVLGDLLEGKNPNVGVESRASLRRGENRGYGVREDGTSASRRAIEAEEEGRYSAGKFRTAYKVARADFDVLHELGAIDGTEWHHTGKRFTRTPFYSWSSDGYHARYTENKKRIGELVKQYEKADWEYRKEEFPIAFNGWTREKFVRENPLGLSEREMYDSDYLEEKYEEYVNDNRAELEQGYAAYANEANARREEAQQHNAHTKGKEAKLLEIARLLGMDMEQAERHVRRLSDAKRPESRASLRRKASRDLFTEARMLRDEERKERQAERAARRTEAKELYANVLQGDFDDVTLHQINDFIDTVTPYEPDTRPLSKRLPPRVGLEVSKGERTGSVDALFSRISESTVPANERTRAEGKRRIEEKKKELLKGWAIATGNWHTDIRDFVDDTKPIGHGKDSDVYYGRDGKSVVKVSHGKENLKKFRPDVDNVALFNTVFKNSKYTILGYGEIDGKFVRFLQQPIVDFTSSTPLTPKERVDYMQHLGFWPMNEEKTAFTNGEIVASDIQGNNIVKDHDGNIRVIDADMRLHTKEVGGQFAYPPVEDDTESKASLREGEPSTDLFTQAEQMREEAERERQAKEANEDITTKASLRTKPAPKKTQKVYKLMRLGEDGGLYPLFIGNSDRTEMGAWYDADSPKLEDLKGLPSGVHLVNNETGKAVPLATFKEQHPEFAKLGAKPNAKAIEWATDNGYRWIGIEDKVKGQSRYGGEARSYYNYGVNGSGSVSVFAMRPGWHAGSLPTMRQIGKGREKNLRDRSFVWVEGEIPADIDYNEEAQRNADRDIPDHIPTDGFYMKATNADKVKSQAGLVGWYVAGAFKANRVMSDAEAREVIDRFNQEHSADVLYDYNREGGEEFTEADAARVNTQNGVESKASLRRGKVEELEEVNRRFNEELERFTPAKADRIIFNLGHPSSKLLLGGVADRPIKLYGSKVVKKMKKHGFTIDELHDLPRAVANPIAVFANQERDGNRSVLTELKTANGNFLVTIDLGKGTDADFDIVSSVFGKRGTGVATWINRGDMRYVNKEKALNYLHLSAPIAEASDKSELSSAAKVVENFENPTMGKEKSSGVTEKASLRRGGSDAHDLFHEAQEMRDEEETRLSMRNNNQGSGWSRETMQQAWDDIMSRASFMAKEGYWDYLASVEEFQNLIAKVTGRKVSDLENAYQAMLALSSRNANEMKLFDSALALPLQKAVLAVTGAVKDFKTGKGRALAQYLIAKHGIERNRDMAVRAALKEQAAKDMDLYTQLLNDWYDDADRIKQQAQANGWTWRQTQEALTQAAETYGADMSTDYSGLTGMLTDEGADTLLDTTSATAQAYQMVEDYEKAHDHLADLWQAVHDISEYSLAKQHKSGLVGKEYVDDQHRRYEYYVPLRGFADPTAEDMYGYLDGQRANGGLGSPVKTAKGRTSESADPLGNLLNVAYRSIASGNKNMALQHFYNLVNGRDTSGLAVTDKMWVENVGTDTNPDWVLAEPQLTDPATGGREMTGEEVQAEMERFNADMEAKRKAGTAKQLTGGKSDPQYRIVNPGHKRSHQVRLNVGGRARVITIAGNPRVALALNGLLNPENSAWPILQRANNFMASAFTNYNVSFGLANLARDTMQSNMRAFIMENPLYWAKFTAKQGLMLGNVANCARMIKMMLDYSAGKQPNGHHEQMFKEFLEAGGATGYTMIRSQEEASKFVADLVRDLKNAKRKKLNPLRLFDLFSFLNESTELVNRFIAYETSREMGRTVERSVDDAKEATLNFNRKGAGAKSLTDKEGTKYRLANALNYYSQYGRSFIVFFNAFAQSQRQLYKMMTEHPAKFTAAFFAAPVTVAAVALPVINNLLLPALYGATGGDGDDDNYGSYYDELSDWERQHNICIRLPKGHGWIKIPLSAELATPFALGDVTGAAFNGQRDLSASDASVLLDLVTPNNINGNDVGVSLVSFLPSGAQFAGHIAINRDFKGSKLYNDSPFAKYQPNWRTATRNTSKSLVALSRGANRLAGGSDERDADAWYDWKPGYVQEMLTGLAGGWASTALAVSDAILPMHLAGGGTEKSFAENAQALFDRGGIPVVSRFVIPGSGTRNTARAKSDYLNTVKPMMGSVESELSLIKGLTKDAAKDVARTDRLLKDAEKTGDVTAIAEAQKAKQEADARLREKAVEQKEKLNEMMHSDRWKAYRQMLGLTKYIDAMMRVYGNGELPANVTDSIQVANDRARELQ